LYKLIHFRIAEEEIPARLAASRPRIRPARHSSRSQTLNSGSISFRLLILVLSLFQCLCYREHTILHTTSERGEGYIAYKLPKEKMGLKTMWPIACGMLHNSTLKRLLLFGIAIKRGGASLQDRMDKEKKPYIFVGLVCVREQYQGDRLGVPVILETDAKSKCDKYVHLGMELAETHDLGAFGKLYDLIRYPRYG